MLQSSSWITIITIIIVTLLCHVVSAKVHSSRSTYAEEEPELRTIEICNMETLNITCHGTDDVILLESARYGRMEIGRCVKGGYGHVGCSSNVIGYLDGRCSGKRMCQFQVPDRILYDLLPCPVDFTSYLELTYSCITVLRPQTCHHNYYNQEQATTKIRRKHFGYIGFVGRQKRNYRLASVDEKTFQQHQQRQQQQPVQSLPQQQEPSHQIPESQHLQNKELYSIPNHQQILSQQEENYPSKIIDNVHGLDGETTALLKKFRRRNKHTNDSLSTTANNNKIDNPDNNNATYYPNNNIRNIECPVTLEVMRGQKINLTLLTFVTFASSPNESDVADHERLLARDEGLYPETCYQVAMVRDGNSSWKGVTRCTSDPRKRHVIKTNTNHLHLILKPDPVQQEIRSVVFEFKVLGCPRLEVMDTLYQSHHVTYENHDTLTVRCNNSAQKWKYVCDGNKWNGRHGNCSSPSVPEANREASPTSSSNQKSGDEAISFGLLFAVSIGVGVGFVVGGILLFLATKYFKRLSQSKNGGYTQPDKQFVCMGHQVKAQMIQTNDSSSSSSARPNTLSYWSSLESQFTPNVRSCESEGLKELFCSLPPSNRGQSQVQWPNASQSKISAPSVIGCHSSRRRSALGIGCPECKLQQDIVCMTSCLDSGLMPQSSGLEQPICGNTANCRNIFVPSDVINN